MSLWVRGLDQKELFKVMAYQEVPEPIMTPELREACKRAIHVLTTDGKVLRAGRAAMFLLKRVGYPKLAWFGSLPGIIWFVELGYFLVARYRGKVYRWFFKGFCSKVFEKHEHEAN